MNVFKAAWLAGIVDGEGSICVRPSPGGCGFIPTVSVGMTHLPTMHEIQRIVHDITGRKYRLYQWQDQPHHKVCYKIMIGRKAAVGRLLETIFPFLVTKRTQAELLIKLTQTPAMYHGRGPKKTLDPWIRSTIDQVCALNHGGISSEAPAGKVGERVETLPSAHDEEEKVQANVA